LLTLLRLLLLANKRGPRKEAGQGELHNWSEALWRARPHFWYQWFFTLLAASHYAAP